MIPPMNNQHFAIGLRRSANQLPRMPGDEFLNEMKPNETK
jgi:hypothetical protein